jgi:hypothetical protein
LLGSINIVSLQDLALRETNYYPTISHDAEGGRLDTWKRRLLNYAVFFCTEFESVYTQKELF